ncbi:MAG: hypothetical protein QOH70_65 [Blastocatellia bacterium]|nr:hypothetical protein [Blastocatellia bacterium]
MKKLISITLTALLLPITILAQSPVAEGNATKPVQQSQSMADRLASTPDDSGEVKLAAGTPVEIESAYTISSFGLRPNDYLSFRVVISARVDGVVVIQENALATGSVVEAQRGRHWGKGGKLTWTMLDVVAVDGTRVPLQVQKDLPEGRDGIKGTSHGGQVATEMAVFGALLFPISPLVLMSGFRRGENAILPQGKRFVVFVRADTMIKVSGSR